MQNSIRNLRDRLSTGTKMFKILQQINLIKDKLFNMHMYWQHDTHQQDKVCWVLAAFGFVSLFWLVLLLASRHPTFQASALIKCSICPCQGSAWQYLLGDAIVGIDPVGGSASCMLACTAPSSWTSTVGMCTF